MTSIKGISVAITTYNHLAYLKKCLYSIKKYSVLPRTEICLFVDGSTDGTFEWLRREGIPHTGRTRNAGAFSGWNNAVDQVQNEYFFLGEDDLFFAPEWDVKLAQWIEELDHNYVVMPQLVEPIWGSYPPIYNCGKTVEQFNEEKFVKYCSEVGCHEAITTAVGLWCIKKSHFLSLDGFDTFYDPVFRGGIEFQVRYARKYPHIRWIRVWDSLMYHFPPQIDARYKSKYYKRIHVRNKRYFEEKYGMNHAQAYASIPVGLI